MGIYTVHLPAGISLHFHLVYISVFGVGFPYSGSLWSYLYCGVSSLCVGLDRVACLGFLVREACVSVLVGGAGFLLSGVQ